MHDKEMWLLGFNQGVSKKTGKKFYLVYFYSKVESVPAVGYQPYTFFINEDQLNEFKAEDLLKKFVVSYVYAGGQNVYISSKKM